MESTSHEYIFIRIAYSPYIILSLSNVVGIGGPKMDSGSLTDSTGKSSSVTRSSPLYFSF